MQKLLILISLYCLGSEIPEASYSYLQDATKVRTIEEVVISDFTTTNNNNRGTNNGTYWFRIENSSEQRSILELKTAHADDLELYDRYGKRIDMMENTRFPAFFISKSLYTFPLYLKVDFPLEAYFPIKISSEKEFAINDRTSFLGIGFFYGTAIAVIIATVLFYFIVSNRQFLYFTVLVIALSISIMGKDNILSLFNYSSIVIRNLEALGHLTVGLCSTAFIVFYAKIPKHQSWIKYIMLVLSTASIFFYIAYLVTENVWHFIAVDVTSVLTVIFLWFVLIQITPKKVRPILGTLYIFDIFMLANSFVLHTLGWSIIEVTPLVIYISAMVNFGMISLYLLLTFRGIRTSQVKNTRRIKRYIAQIKELDAYKNIQDADDEYMESLIYQFDLENIEVKVLDEISKNRSNEYIEEKYSLTKERLQKVTNNLFKKLGIDAADDLSKLGTK